MAQSPVESSKIGVVDLTKEARIRVLHVDDDAGFLKTAKQILEMQGALQVETASSVEEAMENMKKENYDAIVSDYQMPGKDGLEFLKELRKSGNFVPFVIFTGKGREEVAVKALNLGADQYLNKTGDSETVYCELAHNIRQAVERKRALEMRNVCQQRFLCLVENAAAGVGIFDPQGRFTYVNDALANLLGYPARELAGRHFGDFLHKEDKARILESFRQFSELEIEPPTLEFRAVRKDGRLAYLMAKPTMSEIDGKVVGSQAIIVDITERKKMEQDLADNQERLQRIFSASPDAITVSDMNGNIVECNQATLDILELSSKEELIGKSGFEFIPEKDHQRVRENLRRALEQGSMRNVEYAFLTKSGREIPTELSSSVLKDSSGKIVGFVSVAKDLTERKKAEEITKKSNEELKRTFDAFTDFVFIVDKDYRLVRVGKKLCEVLKRKPEELVGKHCYEVVHGTDKPFPNCPHRKTLETKKAASEEVDDPNLGISLLVTNSPVFDERGELIQCVHVAKDITERKKTEESLRESEEKFRGIFESATDTMILLDTAGRILDVNKKAIEVYGGSKEELIGKHFTRVCLGIVSPAIIPKVVKAFAEGLANKKPRLNVTIKNKKGQKIPLECSNSFLKLDNKSVGLLVIGRDVAERKRAEEELVTSETKYRSLVEQSLQGIVVAQGPVPHLVFANAAMSRILGYTPEELTSLSPQETTGLVHPEDRGVFFGRFKDRLEGKPAPSYYEIRGIRKDGTVVLLELSSTRIEYNGHPAVQATFIDITERKKAEEEIESLARFPSENPYPVLRIAKDGVILYANAAAKSMLGELKVEIGRPAPHHWRRLVSDALDSGLKEEVEFENEDRMFLFTLVPVANTAYVNVYGIDVTEHAHARAERNKALERLRILNEKLGVVGKLTKHDVRNKLSAVVGNTYLTKKTLPNNHEALGYLREIESACRQTTRILDFAAAYESLGVEGLTLMDVDKAVEEAVSLISELKGVKVVNNCQGLTVMADSALRQLFFNLIENSLKHGKKVSQIKIHYEEGKDRLKLLYEDNGVGIPKANKPKLFHGGFTTGNSLGYGLALIKSMMEIYGWTIEEDGEPGKGAKFVMTIPKKHITMRARNTYL